MRRQQRRRRYLADRQRADEQSRRWRERNPELVREMVRAAGRRWASRVIREAACEVCGAAFPWTNRREATRKQKPWLRETCSPTCGRRAGSLRERDDR